MMNHNRFQAWLSQVDPPSAAQRGETEAALSGGSQASASLAARCGLAVNTASAAGSLPPEAGIRESPPALSRPTKPMCWKAAKASGTLIARRGGKAGKRGLSSEQVPAPVAADRGGTTVSAVLPAVNADVLRGVIEPAVDEDIVLVSEGCRAYPPCAAATGVRCEGINLSGGGQLRSAFHIRTVNSRHGRLKGFQGCCRGGATEYLGNCLRRFQQVEPDTASPRACLADAIDRSCIRFVN